MMKQICRAALAAAMLAVPAAYAGMPTGQVTGFYETGDADNADFSGFGVAGWKSISGPWFVHGEYAMLSADDFNADFTALRIGGGLVGELQSNLMWIGKAEYLMSGGDADGSGFGIHGGLIMHATEQIGLYGTLGYLSLSDDAVGDDSAGLELNLSAEYAFTPEWSGVLDYRSYMGEYDAAGTDNEVNELRLGVSYSFH